MKKLFLSLAVLAMFSGVLKAGISLPSVFVNEFHYDNAGGDVGEFVEIAVDAGSGLSLSSITVSLYNGSNGTTYNNTTADNLAVGATNVVIGGNLFNLYTWSPSSIQNGSPDGIAVSVVPDSAFGPGVVVTDFISYEGSLTASNGPAFGLTSLDIGVSQTSNTPVGSSLQLVNGVWIPTIGFNTAGSANVIPEPTSAIILAIAGMFAARRRR